MKKNLVKKAVLPALAALVCSVIALTSVSYAWFTMGDTATVGNVSMKVDGADGLQISATGNVSDFKSVLTTSELGGNVATMQGAEVQPLSTIGTVEDGQMVFFTGSYNDAGKLEAKANALGTNYIWFDIYVKVSSARKLYLDKEATVICEGKNTHFASRVAFFDLGSNVKASETQKEGVDKVDSSDLLKAVIWEPNAKTRTQDALNDNHENGKLSYKGIGAAGEYAVGEGTSNVTTYENTDHLEIASLEEGYNRIRVFIWLEGQDVDCLNEVSGGTLVVALKLRQETPAQAAQGNN